MTKIFILIAAILLSGCAKKSESKSTTTGVVVSNCPTSENLSTVTAAQAVANGEKIAQSAFMNGTVGASVTVSQVRVYMSSVGLTSVTLDIRAKTGGSIDSEQLLSTSTVTTGLGSASTSDPISFPITQTLNVGSSYYFIVSAVGGGFSISYATPKLFSSGSISIRTVGAVWNSGPANSSLSMYFTYSGCSGI